MTGGHRQLVPISSRHENADVLVWFTKYPATRPKPPTETTTAFRAYLNPGVAAQYNIRPPSGPRGLTQPIPTKLGGTVSVVTVMLGYSKTPVTLHQVPLRTNGFQGYCAKSVTTNQHPNARCSATSSKERPHPVTN
jgi:hypothetical protein